MFDYNALQPILYKPTYITNHYFLLSLPYLYLDNRRVIFSG